MPTQPRSARRRLNDSSQPESQASQAGMNRPAVRSAAKKPGPPPELRGAAGSGRTGGSSVTLPMVRLSSA